MSRQATAPPDDTLTTMVTSLDIWVRAGSTSNWLVDFNRFTYWYAFGDVRLQISCYHYQNSTFKIVYLPNVTTPLTSSEDDAFEVVAKCK